MSSQNEGNALPLKAMLKKVRYMTSFALISLIIITLGWELWWAPLRSGGSWLVLKVVPLCLLLSGILKGRRYTYQYSSLVILFYFAEAVMRVFDKDWLSSVLASITVGLCLIFFIGCLIYSKKTASKQETSEQSVR